MSCAETAAASSPCPAPSNTASPLPAAPPTSHLCHGTGRKALPLSQPTAASHSNPCRFPHSLPKAQRSLLGTNKAKSKEEAANEGSKQWIGLRPLSGSCLRSLRGQSCAHSRAGWSPGRSPAPPQLRRTQWGHEHSPSICTS